MTPGEIFHYNQDELTFTTIKFRSTPKEKKSGEKHEDFLEKRKEISKFLPIGFSKDE